MASTTPKLKGRELLPVAPNFMQYVVSYRAFILAKCGIGLAYLWLCLDFLRINRASSTHHLQDLLPALSAEAVCGNQNVNSAIVGALTFVSGPSLIWAYCILSPVVVWLYIWGKVRWLQASVAMWVWLSIIGLTARTSIVMTTADFWLSWCFILYLVSAAITPNGQWERSQPAFSKNIWGQNPTFYSYYVLLMVVLQFTVYFYAGLNKLVYGWHSWTSGVALQQLSYDPAMHAYVRGIHIPYLVSLVLCYITLFQRLIVPFGFFAMRYRRWTVLILASMHIGYELLMQVAIFPLIGVSCLLLILPPRKVYSQAQQLPARKPFQSVNRSPDRGPAWWPQKTLAIAVVLLLLIEPAVMSFYSAEAPYWNVKLATQLHWIMFADGGSQSRNRFNITLKVRDLATGTTHYEDATTLPLECFPDTWRTRLYERAIFHKALQAQNPRASYTTTDIYLGRYVSTALRLYNLHSHYRTSVQQFVLSIAPYESARLSP